MMRRFLLSTACVFTGFVTSVVSTPALAQDYPNSPIKIVVPFTPGGGNDFLARDIGGMLSQKYNQSVVVENRPGAGGAIGSAQVARSPADGYTLMIAANTAAMVDATRSDLTFSLTEDFNSIGKVADMPIMLVVNPELGVKTVQELIALAKSKPGMLNYASSGPGTVQHMAAALFAEITGTEMEHVPYKGASQMMPEILANRIQVLFGPANSVLPHIKSGGLVPLGVASNERWQEMPELPTIAEQGVDGYHVDLWYAFLAPAGTPKEIIAKLNRDLNTYLDDADTRKRYMGQALTPAKSTPEEMDQRMVDDEALWKGVAKKINLQLGAQ